MMDRTLSALCSITEHQYCTRKSCECDCHVTVVRNTDVADFFYECWTSAALVEMAKDLPPQLDRTHRFTPLWDLASMWCANNMEEPVYPPMDLIDAHAQVLRNVLSGRFWDRRAVLEDLERELSRPV